MTTFDPNKSNTNPNQAPRSGSNPSTGKPQTSYTQVKGDKKGGKGDKGGKGGKGCGSC